MNRFKFWLFLFATSVFLLTGSPYSYGQKVESKTTNNLNKKKPKASKRDRRRVKKFQAKMAKDEAGKTLKREDRKFMYQNKNIQMGTKEDGDADHPITQKRNKKASNRTITKDHKGRTVAKKNKENDLKSKSQARSSFEPDVVTHPTRKKQIAKKNNLVVTQDNHGNVLADIHKKDYRKSKNKQLSNYQAGNVKSKSAREEFLKDKNQAISNKQEGFTLAMPEQKKMLKKKNEEINTVKGNTMDRKAYRAMLKNKNEEINTVKGNTMDRTAYKSMLKNKNEDINTVKGNTMDRISYKKMLQSKSSKVADFDPEMVLSREEQLSRKKKKSKAIENYEAGYLNSAAERKARIRSFFFPGQYQANTPTEKLNKMRSMSGKIAKYEGNIRQRAYSKKMHPSARHLGKFSLASMEDRRAFQEKVKRDFTLDKRAYLPTYLKDRPQKPKYDKKTEKGLWAE